MQQETPLNNKTQNIENMALVDVLSENELLEGKKLILDFLGVENNESDKLTIKFSLEHQSWEELMKVSEKISITHGDYFDGINSESFYFRHLMFHEIIGKKNFLFRRCVHFIKFYNKAISKNKT